MAFTKTILVAAAVVAVFAQLSAAGCLCACDRSGSSSYDSGSNSYDSGSSSYDSGSNSYDSGSSSYGSSSDNSWTQIPSNAIISSSQVVDNCAYNEIRMPDEPAPAIAVVQNYRPVKAQCLSYSIEVPAEQAQPQGPTYHGVNVHVPVRAKTYTPSLGPLSYNVEVPVDQPTCVKMPNLPVEIAVPVRQRQYETRQHASYSIEVPVNQQVRSRLTNLKANVDRVVLPAQEFCLPPNNGPSPVQQVHYVAVPAPAPVCPSPVGLLGLPKGSGAGSYAVPSDSGSYSGSYSSDSSDSNDSSDSGSSSSSCRCPCDD